MARYHSCARCGYRGVDHQHLCESDRLRAGAEVERAAPASADETAAPPRAPSELDGFGLPQAAKLELELSTLLGRAIAIGIRGSSYQIVQRCTACRQPIESLVMASSTSSFFDAFARAGTAARRGWLVHRCEPVERSLAALGAQELATLEEELERDSVRLAERAAEVRRLLQSR